MPTDLRDPLACQLGRGTCARVRARYEGGTVPPGQAWGAPTCRATIQHTYCTYIRIMQTRYSCMCVQSRAVAACAPWANEALSRLCVPPPPGALF